MPEEKKDAYQLFDAFLESFIEKKSFITKDEGVYNADLFKELKRIYIEKGLSTPDYHIEKTKYPDFEEDGSVGLFFNKAMLQVGHISNEEYRDKLRIVFSDMLWLHYLPIFEMSDVNKNMRISQWLNNGNLYDHIFPEKGLASYSFAKQMIDQDLQFLINLFSDLLNEMVSDKIDVETLKSKIKEFSINTKRYPPIRNMLLNLCFQKEYEPISTTSTKEKIARNLYPFFFKIEWDDKNVNVDVALQNIVNEININNFTKYGEHFMEKGERFFAKEIEKLWKNEYVANTYEILTKYQKQVILYGAPGTSKTYNAERAIEEFLDNSDFDKTRLFNNNKLDLGKIKFSEYEKKQDDNDFQSKFIFNLSNSEINDTPVIWEIIQFNQNYSYEDFIEGLIPKSDKSIGIKDGIFKRFVDAAIETEKEKKEISFILIIDEINRGKIDKIFGELLYLLEYRDDTLRLHYSGMPFSIPKNIYIIGTMNTADKSIAALDVALRRRFWFVKLDPNRDVLLKEFRLNDDNLKKVTDSELDEENVRKLAILLFDWLNKKGGRLEDILKDDANELKIGHTYFLKLNELKDLEGQKRNPIFADLKNIWFYSIVPLLEEYVGFDKKELSKMLTASKVKDLTILDNFNITNIKNL